MFFCFLCSCLVKKVLKISVWRSILKEVFLKFNSLSFHLSIWHLCEWSLIYYLAVFAEMNISSCPPPSSDLTSLDLWSCLSSCLSHPLSHLNPSCVCLDQLIQLQDTESWTPSWHLMMAHHSIVPYSWTHVLPPCCDWPFLTFPSHFRTFLWCD